MSSRHLNKHRQTAELGLAKEMEIDPHSSRDIDTEPKIQTDREDMLGVG